jgi:hypothetical protein
VASDWLGVSFAPDDDLFTVSPTWTRLDLGQSGLRVAEIQIGRGRQSEFEETGTGTCTVLFHDREGLLDPTNDTSPFFGKLLSRPFAIAIRNPVTDEWEPRFRGTVDDAGYDVARSRVKFDTAIVAVDAFDYFSNFELVPGLSGFVNAQVNAGGYVFYEDAGFDERLNKILQDCQWPVGLSSVFTGNVIVDECVYSAGDKIMQALQEAIDAEFPTVAGHYIDRRGFYQAHGRYARFNPDEVSASATNWDFTRWKAGDDAACVLDPDTARMQPPFGFSISRKMIRNAALAYPQGADRTALNGLVETDEPSRAEHGTRTWTAENLKVLEGTTTGNTDPIDECSLFAEYIISNYAQPQLRVNAFTIGTVHPDSQFADATWDMLTRCDISDSVEITIGLPGVSGISSVEFFIEGLQETYRPGPGSLDDTYPFVKLQADLSPAAYWATNPFPDFTT